MNLYECIYTQRFVVCYRTFCPKNRNENNNNNNNKEKKIEFSDMFLSFELFMLL